MENEVEVVQGSALSAITESEINVQIATAKKYPRSLEKFRQDALSMATIDQEIAESCFYKLPRGGKILEGPSVRLAEIVGSSWGNLRYAARIVSENNKEVTAQGICHDLEKNVASSVEVSRRITDKLGKTFKADMIQVTKNAACSIALRNAIFKAVPFVYVKSVYDQAKKAAVGTIKTLPERRSKMFISFAAFGVTEDVLLKHLGKNSIEDVNLSDIELLIGLYNAVKDGDTSIDEVFKTKKDIAEPKKKNNSNETPKEEKKEEKKEEPKSNSRFKKAEDIGFGEEK